MIYRGETIIRIPWFDTEGKKNWSQLRINGDIDRRRLLRGVCDFAKKNFNKTVSNAWVLKNCLIINVALLRGKNKVTPISHQSAFDKHFEEWKEGWIARLEAETEDETDDEANTSGEGSPVEGAEPSLQVVSDKPEGSSN